MLYSALIGNPVSHSVSPIMYQKLAEASGLHEDYTHLKVGVNDNRLASSLMALKELGFIGFNVTLPHKLAVMQYLDSIDSSAQEIGAVNTVQICDGQLVGFNTDWLGLYRPLKQKFHDKSVEHVTILGSGGAARAAIYAARKLGAEYIYVHSRDENQSNTLRAYLKNVKDSTISVVTYDSVAANIQKSTIVINATSAGMTGHDRAPFELDVLAGIDISQKTCFDAVFKPLRTPLLAYFSDNGADTIDGLWMMIHQGVEAFKLWTGRLPRLSDHELKDVHAALKLALQGSATHVLGINFDEISDNLDPALSLMQELGIRHAELRTVDGKNFVSWTDNEVVQFKEKIQQHSISLVAAATPLFKWYADKAEPDIPHDNFGFNPRLTTDAKKKVIARTIAIASQLSISRLRIFSELGATRRDGGKRFARSPLLSYALEIADRYGIDLYLENEPVCRINTKKDIIDFIETNQHPRLKVWLDVANLLELGEEIDEAFISAIQHRLGYVHVKDFKKLGSSVQYVPVGEGDIDYPLILATIFKNCPNADLVLTVETHAKEDKVTNTRSSLINTMRIMKEAEQ